MRKIEKEHRSVFNLKKFVDRVRRQQMHCSSGMQVELFC